MTTLASPPVFRAMGTEVEVLAEPAVRGQDVARVRAWFEKVEAALSRFRPESELCRVNARSGAAADVSPLFRDVLAASLAGAKSTAGLVDPTVLGCLEGAGYSRSFEAGPSAQRYRTARPDYRRVALSGSRVRLPPGLGLDFGGVAKGWAVDRCAPLLRGYESWLVNAGGDLLAHGTGPGGDGWLVGIEDPFHRGVDVLVLRVQDRAVATSSVMRRRWTFAVGETAHHVINPRTGQPARTDLASVTVLGRTTLEAEVEAKALLILGSREGRKRAERLGIGGVTIDRHGRVAFLGRAGDSVAA